MGVKSQGPERPTREFGGPDRPRRARRRSRRDALVRIGAATGVLAGSAVLGRALWDKGGFASVQDSAARQVRDYRVAGAPKPQERLELAIAKGANPGGGGGDAPPKPEDLVRRAVDALGGMKTFVSRGDVVVIKPNIGWDRLPIHAANTNPDVVGAVVKLAFDAGAKKVIVADGSCNDPNRCFQRSGDLARGVRASAQEVVAPRGAPLPHDAHEGGKCSTKWPIFTTCSSTPTRSSTCRSRSTTTSPSTPRQ